MNIQLNGILVYTSASNLQRTGVDSIVYKFYCIFNVSLVRSIKNSLDNFIDGIFLTLGLSILSRNHIVDYNNKKNKLFIYFVKQKYLSYNNQIHKYKLSSDYLVRNREHILYCRFSCIILNSNIFVRNLYLFSYYTTKGILSRLLSRLEDIKISVLYRIQKLYMVYISIFRQLINIIGSN